MIYHQHRKSKDETHLIHARLDRLDEHNKKT